MDLSISITDTKDATGATIRIMIDGAEIQLVNPLSNPLISTASLPASVPANPATPTPKRVAGKARMTKRIAGEIRWLAKKGDLCQHDIAAKYGVNQGRVSEVMNGHTFKGVRAVRPTA